MKKLRELKGKMNPCLCCPPIPGLACMGKLIAVGFGDAHIECDGEFVANGEMIFDARGYKKRDRKRLLTFRDAERMAAKNPRKDWRVVLHGPLHGETYQRQGSGKWILVKSNQGFA